MTKQQQQQMSTMMGFWQNKADNRLFWVLLLRHTVLQSRIGVNGSQKSGNCVTELTFN